MQVYHFCKKNQEKNIDDIYETKEFYLSKFSECSGQDDFCLTKQQFIESIMNINYDVIQYKNELSRTLFEAICEQVTKHESDFFFSCNDIYGCSTTIDKYMPTREESLKEKYGKSYIQFDIEPISNKNFFFVSKVEYALNNETSNTSKQFSSFCYKLFYYIFMRFYYMPSIIFGTENHIDDNLYKEILTRGYYYLKILYKKQEFRKEKEYRIIFDLKAIRTLTIFGRKTGNLFQTENTIPSEILKYLTFEFNDGSRLSIDDYIALNNNCTIYNYDNFLSKLHNIAPEQIKKIILKLGAFNSLNLIRGTIE